MRVWTVYFKHREASDDSVYDWIRVNAESIEEAIEKAKKWAEENYPGLDLEISGVELEGTIHVL